MTPETLEKRLELWKRWLLVGTGASITLLVWAIVDLPNLGRAYAPGWFYVWPFFQIAITPAGLVLLIGKAWRELPLSQRLDTAFGYLGVAWLTLLAFGIKSGSDTSVLQSVLGATLLTLIIGGSAMAIGLSYWILSRNRLTAPEEMFP